MSIWDGMRTKKEKVMRKPYWSDAETVELWMDEDCRLKENSRPGYRNSVRRFGNFLDGKGITTATKKDAEDFLNHYSAANGDGAAYNTMSILSKYSRWLFKTHRVGEDIFLDLNLNFTYKSAREQQTLKSEGNESNDTYTLAELAEILLKLNEYDKDDVMKILEG